MRKFGNLELIRAKFVDIFREDNKANAMHIRTVQSKSEREKKTELGKYTCRLAQSTQGVFLVKMKNAFVPIECVYSVNTYS